MFANFTDRSRKVLILANEEARRLGQEYMGTEHILMGLVNEGDGVAAQILTSHNVDLQKIHSCMEATFPQGEVVLLPDGQRTPGAKKIIDNSLEEARQLDHDYIGTEHLLLGLLREKECLAAQILVNLGVQLATARQEILRLLTK